MTNRSASRGTRITSRSSARARSAIRPTGSSRPRARSTSLAISRSRVSTRPTSPPPRSASSSRSPTTRRWKAGPRTAASRSPWCRKSEWCHAVRRRLVEAVEPPRVVQQDFLLHPVRQVGALGELRDVVQEVGPGPLVREVGGEEDPVLADQLDDVGQRPLLDLAREVDVALADVLHRFPAEERAPPRAPLLELVVHAIHHVGHPAGAALEERDP